MLAKNAVSEYTHIIHLQSVLKTIPHYRDYFLIYDAKLCHPARLTHKDLVSFQTCKGMMPENVTKDTINNHLERFLSLTLPNGGMTLESYFAMDPPLYPLHRQLMQLLERGILPMNHRHVYHADIKDENILVHIESNGMLKTRLIDWGLTISYNPKAHRDPIAHEPWTSTKYPWTNRNFMFNMPFSCGMFTKPFYDIYTAYLEKGGNLEQASLLPLLVNYFQKVTMDPRGQGHLLFINQIMVWLFQHDDKFRDVPDDQLAAVVEAQITLPVIVQYCFTVLVHFTKPSPTGKLKLHATQYINEVFTKTLDIYGFLSAYIPLVKELSNKFSTLSRKKGAVFLCLKDIFIKHLYEPRVHPPHHRELRDDLQTLGLLIQDA